MAYKDKEKQREAVRQATRCYRAKLKGITPVSPTVIPCDTIGAKTVIPTCDQIVDVLHERIVANPKVTIKPQSHNPMRVGYVPPRKDG